MPRVLLLGGTTEAGLMAHALAAARVTAIYSYAGRTDAPVAQPLPTRLGGFGGVAGLASFLQAERISHVVDATHPFAAQMTANAVQAAAIVRVPLIGLQRQPWQAGSGDQWRHVPDIAGAVAALPDQAGHIFLAIGRQNLAAFAAKPQHNYLLRLVDPLADLPLPQAAAVVARGPFTVEGDLALMQRYRISHVVAKNAGGQGAQAKLEAARILGLTVILIERPAVPVRQVVETVGEVMNWLHADLGV